jgi:streptogramin lyase
VVDFRHLSGGSGRPGGPGRGFGFRFMTPPRVLVLFCLTCWCPRLVFAQAQTGAAPGPSVAVSGLSLPSAIASDSQGNLYIVDEGCGIPAGGGDCNVYKEAASGGSYTQSRVASFTSANLPTSIAVDAAGNVYIGVTGQGLLRETPSGQAYTQTSVGCAFSKPTALALDGKGNLYVADSGTGRVYREKPEDTCNTASVVASLTNVTGLAVDTCGSVYVAQSAGSSAIVKETPANGGYVQSSVGSELAGLIGTAVDDHQDVYYSDLAGNVAVLVPNGRQYTRQTVMSGLPFAPIGGLAVDGASNLYIADFANSRVWKSVPSFPLPAAPACGSVPAAPAGAPAAGKPPQGR